MGTDKRITLDTVADINL